MRSAPQAFQTIYAVVRQIPPGRVSTYGRIACLCGNPRWARVVGYAMAACRQADVPCHRVLHRDGSASAAFEEDGINRQVTVLKSEEAVFLPDGRVDLKRCGWPG